MISKKTGMRDWKMQEIKDGDILITQQGTKFVVDYSEYLQQWTMIQCNENNHPDLQGQRFKLDRTMQSNIEVIGSIYVDQF